MSLFIQLYVYEGLYVSKRFLKLYVCLSFHSFEFENKKWIMSNPWANNNERFSEMKSVINDGELSKTYLCFVCDYLKNYDLRVKKQSKTSPEA